MSYLAYLDHSMTHLDYLDEAEAIRLVQLSIAGAPEHVVILHKAECFMTDDYKRFCVSGDVLVWLAAYCRHPYEVKSIALKAKVIKYPDMSEDHTGFEGKIYFVGFDDENDAFHFKMRWGGR